jgi:hypothetical protein
MYKKQRLLFLMTFLKVRKLQMERKSHLVHASKQTTVSVLHISVAVCTVLNSDEERKDRPKHVECYSKINKFEKLVHLVGFTIEIFCNSLPNLI